MERNRSNANIFSKAETEIVLDRALLRDFYYWSEVEAFAKIFYKPPSQQASSDHVEMQKCLQPAVDRFNGIEERRPDRRLQGHDMRQSNRRNKRA